MISDIDHIRHLVSLEIERLLHFERFENVKIDDVGVFHNNNSVAYAVFEKVYAVIAHLGRNNSVLCRGSAAALDVSENGFSRFNARLFLNALGKIRDVRDAVVNAVLIILV